ncbi:hypothetical protein [Streptomyces sp. NPDC006335]|uniref:hypothetical protein n=1 Tax=Streptomyces sp. NPDC006335 TaxID=3156895 RepID=UPI0033B32ACE
MTEHSTRAIRFAAAYALLHMAADVGDHWINAAKAVPTFLRVSVRGWHRLPSRVCCRSVVSRLSSVNTSARSAFLGVTGA